MRIFTRFSMEMAAADESCGSGSNAAATRQTAAASLVPTRGVLRFARGISQLVLTTYTVTVPGHAKGKQRARVALRGGKARAYTPQQTVNAEAWVRHCCVSQVGSPCLEGPLSVEVRINVAIPASWSKKKQAEAEEGRLFPTSKPDLTNTGKLAEDALNGILWRDDSQIVDLTLSKRYAKEPGMTITARAINQNTD
jgi:Holliday junction resolvase RusA-like endonuclease